MAKPEERLTRQIRARRDYTGPEFLRLGFRPFFLAAGVWAIVCMSFWLHELAAGFSLPFYSYLTPLDWHRHEMLFGFVAAAIAGFLMTAIPNWTGRLPVRGIPLLLLALLWLAGRVAMLASPLVPEELHPLLALIDSAFLIALALLMGREIVAGKNWRNLKLIAVLGALALCNLLFHLAMLDVLPDLDSDQVALAAVLLISLLVNIVGGRVVPSFTRNWLAQRGKSLPAPRDRVDEAGDISVALAALLVLLLPFHPLTAALCLLAAALQLYRLSRWRGWLTVGEPIVLVLHVGFSWIGIGFLLAGLAALEIVPLVAAVHALTTGLFGAMILAVMTRATRGHSGVPIEADRATIAAYALVTVSAIARLATILLDLGEPGHLVAGISWMAAYGLFVAAYFPLFVKSALKTS